MNSSQSKQNLSLDQVLSGIGIELPETSTHPFIIKIWLEETVEEASQATWRGHITHVPSGERCYLKDLDDVTAFIAPYLERMGVEFGIAWRVRLWLRRWKLYLNRSLSSRMRMRKSEDKPEDNKDNK